LPPPQHKTPSDFRIAALEPKMTARQQNLMLSGSGIPWEDRGSLGILSAFFATAFGMIFKPSATLAKMARPETNKDARIFTYACAAVWFFAVLIQSAFAYYVFFNRNASIDVEGQQYVINTLGEAAIAGAAAVLAPRIIAWMFYRLTSFDMTSKAPFVLVYNCIAYLMGISLLALIPGGPKPTIAIGPILAGIWMFAALIIVAIKYLRIRAVAALIGSILTFVAVSAVVIGAIFALTFLWTTLFSYSAFPAPYVAPKYQ
jgi:hypothetical protein